MINSGVLGVVTLAVAATSVHAFPKIEGLTEGKGGSVTTTGGSSSSHSSGSVHCSSGAFASSFSGYKDAYASAVTDVVKSACDPHWGGNMKVMYDAAIDFGYVFANAYVEAGAQCVSSATGDAKVEGCAFAEASAYAWDFAFVDVHASASAKAITDYCGCGGDATAIDWAVGSISQELIADAFASVEVAACVSGNDEAVAYASVDCYADIFAYVYASSFAKALVYSDCYPYADDAVYAEAKITVDSWVYENDQCTFIEYAKGLTSVVTDGSSSTETVGRH